MSDDTLRNPGTDISEQERWLRESQKAGGVGSYHFDFGKGVWNCTPTMEEIFGIGPDYARTFQGWVDIVAPEQRGAMAAYFGSLLESGDRFDREYRIVRICDGQERWVHGRGEFLRDASGAIASLIGTIMDVTSRKQADEKLRLSEEKFGTVFNRAPLMMTISSLDDGRYIDVNREFCEVSGFLRDEAIGKTSVELGWLEAGPRERLLDAIRAEGRVSNVELSLRAKDRRPVACLFSGELISVEGKQLLLSIALDITEKIRMQEQLNRTQKLESLGVLAGGIAHDFNNILTAVLGNLSFARRLVGSDHRAAARLAECEKATVRAGELTQQLLTFSRGGAPVKRTVDTGKLLDEIQQFALRGSNVKGVLDLAPELWCLDADEGQVGQLLNNLLINAKQAMPCGGTVTITALNETVAEKEGDSRPAGRYVSISVRDVGTGISPENLGRIFDPYFTTKESGSGLGLASVHSIVRRHRGDVSVSSIPGKGTEFIVRLPAAAPGETAGGTAPTDNLETLPTGVGRILVMDDEELLARLAAMMLGELGYVVETCADGAEAIERYRNAIETGSPFAAVILDLTVPGGLGGREAAAGILEIDPGAVLVVSSGYSNDPVLADCRAYGFMGSVAKPYTMGTLAGEIARLTNRRPPP